MSRITTGVRYRQTILCCSLIDDLEDDERKAEIDKHKDESLDKQKSGKGEWKKELASSSEAAVRLIDAPALTSLSCSMSCILHCLNESLHTAMELCH